MRKTLLVVLAMALAPFCAFAVDGVVLINLSTVMAQGGYPYRITGPGSYKLSGNLTPPVDQQAIQISANNVTLDLNGFNVTCNFDANYHAVNNAITCVGDGQVAVTDVAIRNGTVIARQTGGNPDIVPVVLESVGFSIFSSRLTIEDLNVRAGGTSVDPFALVFGPYSIIRHNILIGGSTFISCPSLVEGNVNTSAKSTGNGSGCIFDINIGITVF